MSLALAAASSEAFRYEAFGLAIASAVELPELSPGGDGAADVVIGYGQIVAAPGDSLDWEPGYRADERRLIVTIPAAGRFEIADGSRITIEPAPGVEQRRIRLLLLGTMFAALLMQRDILPIHGSAMLFEGQAVVFAGHSGAGKSSLLAAFRQRGAALLTDDIAAITTDSAGMAWLQPAYPQQKLWRDSAQALGIDLAGRARILAEHDKYAIPVSTAFASASIPVDLVCELQVSACAAVSIQGLPTQELASTLIRHTFHRALVGAMSRQADHFSQCTELSRRTRGLRMVRPADTFTLDEQVRLLRSHLAHRPEHRPSAHLGEGLGR